MGIDPHRAQVEEVLLALLRTLRTGAEIVIISQAFKKPQRLEWPAPASPLFGGQGVPELAPEVPDKPPPDERRRRQLEGGAEVSPDWLQVYWPGAGRFLLNAKQAAVVRCLYEAWLGGNPDVRDSALLAAARKAGSDAPKLRQVFQHSNAWGKLVVPGQLGGTSRLPDLPEDLEAE